MPSNKQGEKESAEGGWAWKERAIEEEERRREQRGEREREEGREADHETQRQEFDAPLPPSSFSHSLSSFLSHTFPSS